MRWYSGTAIATWCLAAHGCGRVDFDPTTATSACLTENFGSGSAGWTSDGSWSLDPTGGPDGSPALTTAIGGVDTVEAPGVAAITFVDLQVGFLISDAAVGDFLVFLEPHGKQPYVDPDPNYTVAMHPAGSDSALDLIAADTNILAQVPASLAAHTWYQLEVVRHVDGSIDVELDGAPYLQSPADDTIPGPLDVYIGFYQGGSIDNIHASCAR